MDHTHLRHLHGKGQKLSHDIALKSKALIADDTWLFVFEKPPGFRYRAGQHVRMTLPRLATRDPAGKYRFWSFASAPCEDDLAFAVRMRPSPFKLALSQLAIGDTVHIDMLADPPKGAFALEPDDRRPVVFLAGGIGVVPAYAMLKQVLAEGSERDFLVICSNHRPQDAPFLAELQALAAGHANVRLVATMTRLDASHAWPGDTGRISPDMLKRYLPDIKAPVYYIAGLQGMVAAMQTILAEAGVAKAAIHSEEFGSFTMATKRRPSAAGRLSLLALALILAAVTALHAVPVVLIMRNLDLHPAWSNPLVYLVPAVALAIVIKIGLMSRLHRRG